MGASDWRTSVLEVKNILETDLSDSDIEMFIRTAHIHVTNVLGTVNARLGEDTMELIEMWLTAHLIACTKDHQASAEGDGAASITYQGQTAMALDSTHYGQMVKMLDTTGLLSNASKGKTPAVLFAVKSFS